MVLPHRARILGGFLLLAFLFAAGFVARTPSRPVPPTVLLPVPGGPLRVEVVETPAAQALGLSGRPGLAPDQGMLFRFDRPASYGFWMKDMRFSIDILYLREGRLVQVFADLPAPGPGEPPRAVVPDAPADAVLEVAAGTAARRGWVPGTVLFPPKSVH